MPADSSILWSRILQTDRYLFAEFEIPGGVIDHGALAGVALPPQAARTDLGIIFSGRGPIWLHAHLSHLAHIFAWVGIYDPRLLGAVIVQRHCGDAPGIGEVVRVTAEGDRERGLGG